MIGNSGRVVSCKYTIFIPQSKCDFIENHRQRTVPPFFLPLGSESSGFPFFMYPPQPMESQPQRKKDNFSYLLKSMEVINIGYLIISFPISSLLANFSCLITGFSETQPWTPPILEIWHSGTDASLGVR